MNGYTWVLLVLGIISTAVGSPVLLAYLNGKQAARAATQAAGIRRQEKEQDWARQDEVARQVTEAASQAAMAARLLVQSNAQVAEKVAGVAETAAAAAAVTIDKLNVIHSLVDGNVTTVLQSVYDGNVRELVMMRELFKRDAAEGLHQSPDAQAAIAAMVTKIDELGAKLADRRATETQIHHAEP
jgi:hypothetical protein